MSRLVLHRAVASPPARAVMMLADILELPLEYRDVNIVKKEHRTTEFKKLNPMATVPVLEDGDFVLSESNAILKYLLEKYGADHREGLYPSAVQMRALVDQCMFFTAGVLFTSLRDVGSVTLNSNLEAPTAAHKIAIDNGYSIIDAYLHRRRYIAADRLTLADLSAGATATALQVMHKVDEDKFPRCADWLARLEEEPFFKTINREGVTYFGKLMNAFWEKNKQRNRQKD